MNVVYITLQIHIDGCKLTLFFISFQFLCLCGVNCRRHWKTFNKSLGTSKKRDSIFLCGIIGTKDFGALDVYFKNSLRCVRYDIMMSSGCTSHIEMIQESRLLSTKSSPEDRTSIRNEGANQPDFENIRHQSFSHEWVKST